jgi:FMN-dependent NADH-azoreductase
MSKLLHLDTSIQTSNSVSRRLSAAIVDALKATEEGIEVTYRDLATNPLPHLTLPVFTASVQPGSGAELTAAQQEDAKESAKVLDEFLAADTIVIGVAFYNYSVPSSLRAWIDRVVVAGKTFNYGPTGPVGFAGGKRVILSIARGGIFAKGSPNERHEHGESYLRSVFSLVGINDVEVVMAEGLAINADHRDAALHAAMEQIDAISAQAA